MKKLLIMSMVLFFSVPFFAQTKTVKSNSAAVEDVKKKTADAYDAVKKKAATLGNTKDNKGKVTRPSKGTNQVTLTLLNPNQRPGTVTRPGKNDINGQWDSRLTLDDGNDRSNPGNKTNVTRPSKGTNQVTLTLLNPNQRPGTVTRPGKNDINGQWDSRLTLDDGNDRRNPGNKTNVTRPSNSVREDIPTTLIEDFNRPTNNKTSVSRRGGTRRR